LDGGNGLECVGDLMTESDFEAGRSISDCIDCSESESVRNGDNDGTAGANVGIAPDSL
jgi:hypothetical protein